MLVLDEGELTISSSIFSAPTQDSIPAEILALGRIQTHSFCTVFIEYFQDWVGNELQQTLNPRTVQEGLTHTR